MLAVSNSNLTRPIVRLTVKEQKELTEFEHLILFYRKNPVIAVKDIFNIELTWFQRICVRAWWNKKFVLFLMARGLSKTFTSALCLSLYAILYPNTRLGIIAPSYRQTWYVLDYIDEFYNNSAFFRNCCTTKGTMRNNMRSIIKMKNGSFIEALPIGDGSKIRGRRYHVLLIDEYAQMQEDVIKLVIMPMMNIKIRGRENKLIIASTAWYPFTHFYGTYVSYKYLQMSNPDEYEVCEFDIDDLRIVKDPPFELDMKLINKMRNDPNMTDEEFMMENYCKFPTEMQNFITPSLIAKCTPSGMEEHYFKNGVLYEGCPIETVAEEGHTYVAGCDVARSPKGDNFAITILKLSNDSETVRFVNCFADHGLSFQEMLTVIRIYCVDFDLSAIYMDKSGGGAALEDLLFQPWKDERTGVQHPRIFSPEDKDVRTVNGLGILFMRNFTQPFISMMYHTLKASMQQRKLLFPIDRRRDEDKTVETIGHNLILTKQELVQLRAEPKGPFVQFSTGSKQKKDRATALGLGNLAAVEYKRGEVISQSKHKQLIGTGLWVSR